jgi:hypothetical protein
MNKKKTKVLFLVQNVLGKDFPVAILPEVKKGDNEVICYDDHGFESTASYEYCMEQKLATKEQYQPVYDLLASKYGLNIEVLTGYNALFPAIPQQHIIEVSGGKKAVTLRSYYHDQEITIPFNSEPGTVTASLDTALDYLIKKGFKIVSKCVGKRQEIYHIVTDTFKQLVKQ